MAYSVFLFLPDWVLADYIFLRIYALHSGCPDYWNMVVHLIFYDFLYFSGFSCYFFFISDFIYIGSLSFFLNDCLKLHQSLYLITEPALGFIDLLYWFLDYMTFISALDLYYFIFLLTLWLFCSLFKSLNCGVRYFIRSFSRLLR